MTKYYHSLGLMSGTSGDGIDASVIYSDGYDEYRVILDKYFKYDQHIYENIHNIKSKINKPKDLELHSKEIKSLEKEITLFHAKAINEIIKNFKGNIDLIGFHGQTIFHNANKKISKQLGNANLLSQLVKKDIIYNFRENDLNNGGQGAPLTPIFHNLLAKKFKVFPTTFLNLGGIANTTSVNKDNSFYASDIGPGMCLIDEWIRSNSEYRYDKNGQIAKSGKVNKLILEKALESIDKKFQNKNNNNLHRFTERESFDTKDFNVAFVRGLSLEDGAATLTEYTAQNIILVFNAYGIDDHEVTLCGGGRKNKFLTDTLKKNISIKFIDDYGVDGDFIESQAFAYLAIRSFLKLEISFPETTGVIKPCSGGVIIKS